MEDVFILDKRKRTVRIEDREFVMREMGAEAYRDYTKNLIEAGKEAKARLSNRDYMITFDAALQVASDTEMILLMELLKEPVDSTKPADEAFLRTLSYSQRGGVFKLQDELNGTAELLKNLVSLLA